MKICCFIFEVFIAWLWIALLNKESYVSAITDLEVADVEQRVDGDLDINLNANIINAKKVKHEVFPCNIQVRDADELNSIQALNFPSFPIIYRGRSDRNKALADLSSYDNLMGNYGHYKVHLTSSNTYSQGEYSTRLDDYIKSFMSSNTATQNSNETYYLFGNNYDGVFSDMAKLYRHPSCPYCKETGATTVGIGGIMSGVSFHFHGPGFSETIIGRKRWFLFPPEIRSPPGHDVNVSVARWVDEFYPLIIGSTNNSSSSSSNSSSSSSSSIVEAHLDSFGRSSEDIRTGIVDALEHNNGHRDMKLAKRSGVLYECVLVPGDMLYFPKDWMHATLNLDPFNVFVSLFVDPQLLPSKKIN